MSSEESNKNTKEVRKLADGSCLLLSTSDVVQMNLLENMLAESGIPFLAKDQGMGTYLKIFSGQSFYPTDIYVNPGDYDRAKELLDCCFAGPETELETESETETNGDIAPEENGENQPFHRQKKISRIFFAVILLLNLAAFLYGVISLIISTFQKTK